MPAQNVSNFRAKAVLSVAGMAKEIHMSRSQFYSYVRRGFFPQPLFTLATKRPFYPADMQQEIMTTRQTGLTPEGQYILFYDRAERGTAPSSRQPVRRDAGSEWVSRLGELGLVKVTAEQVSKAMVVCFPSGTTGMDDGTVLRTLYRHLRCSIAG